jgi:hypothetical protein
MMSARPSLLGATLATDVFGSSLLRYHCSDTLVAMGQLLVAIVTYGLLLQCLIVVLMHRLVLPNQSAFIRGRAIRDNFHAVQSSAKLLHARWTCNQTLHVVVHGWFDHLLVVRSQRHQTCLSYSWILRRGLRVAHKSDQVPVHSYQVNRRADSLCLAMVSMPVGQFPVQIPTVNPQVEEERLDSIGGCSGRIQVMSWAGRTTLVKVMLTAIPVHVSIVVEVSPWIYKEINRL